MQANSYGTYDDNDEWIECKKCRYPMLPLRDYEVQTVSEFPAIEGEGLTFIFFGLTWFVIQTAYKFLVGLVTFGVRKKQLAQYKVDYLPQFPNSLVCPKCQNLKKRK